VNTLYFTAGIPAGGMVEDHGLFGQINAVPEPSTVLAVAAGLALLAIRIRAREHMIRKSEKFAELSWRAHSCVLRRELVSTLACKFITPEQASR